MLPVVESEKSHIKEVWSTGRVNRQQYLKICILTDLRIIAEKPTLQLSVDSLTAALGAWLGAKKHGIATRRSAFASRVTEYIGRLREQDEGPKDNEKSALRSGITDKAQAHDNKRGSRSKEIGHTSFIKQGGGTRVVILIKDLPQPLQ